MGVGKAFDLKKAIHEVWAVNEAMNQLLLKHMDAGAGGGAARLCLMLAHDAHHRGQIMMLARQLGYRLPGKVNYGIWHWGKLWRSLGMARGWPVPVGGGGG